MRPQITQRDKNLHGTWRWVKELNRDGKEYPKLVGLSVTYRFSLDGSSFMRLSNGLAVSMQWKINDGRLRMKFGGEKGHRTTGFEITPTNVLTLFDRYGHRSVFERISDNEANPWWIVSLGKRNKKLQVSYEDDDQCVCHFGFDLQQGRWIFRAYQWWDTNGIMHDSDSKMCKLILPRMVDFLQKWLGDRLDILFDPPKP